MQKKYPLVGDVRGLGAMLGMELVKDRSTKAPAKAECAAIVQECLQKGLIVPSAGIYGNVIRLLVALVITDDELVEGLDVLDAAIGKVSKG